MKTLRQLTDQQYDRTYNQLIRECGSKNLDQILNCISNKSIKLSTKLFYLNVCISLQSTDPEKFDSNPTSDLAIREMRNNLSEELKAKKKEDNLTERQRIVLEKVTIKDVYDALEKLKTAKNDSVSSLENYILLSLMLPNPLRNDLADIKIVKKKGDLKNNNALWLPSKKDGRGILRISEYKTSDLPDHDPIQKVLDPDLTNDIKHLVKKTCRTLLFGDRNGNPYSSSSFSHKLSRMFKTLLGVPFSSCVLRKIFWTGEREKIEELRNSAKNCGHTLHTAITTYMGTNVN